MKTYKDISEAVGYSASIHGKAFNKYLSMDPRKLKKYAKAFQDNISDVQKKSGKSDSKKELDDLRMKLAQVKYALSQH